MSARFGEFAFAVQSAYGTPASTPLWALPLGMPEGSGVPMPEVEWDPHSAARGSVGLQEVRRNMVSWLSDISVPAFTPAMAELLRGVIGGQTAVGSVRSLVPATPDTWFTFWSKRPGQNYERYTDGIVEGMRFDFTSGEPVNVGVQARGREPEFLASSYTPTNQADIRSGWLTYIGTEVRLDWGSGFAGGPPPVTSGLVGDYNFGDMTSLYQDAARTTAITASGQGIGGVTDKSGAGHHLSQATAANRPTFLTGAVNGGGAASFDGSNDSLSGTVFTADRTDLSLYVVAQRSSLASVGPIVEWGSATVMGCHLWNYDSGDKVYVNVGPTVQSGSVLTAGVPFRVGFTASPGVGRLYKDGAQVGANVSSATVDVSDPMNLALRATGAGPVNNWLGMMSRVLVYDRALSPAEVTQLDTYLAAPASSGSSLLNWETESGQLYISRPANVIPSYRNVKPTAVTRGNLAVELPLQLVFRDIEHYRQSVYGGLVSTPQQATVYGAATLKFWEPDLASSRYLYVSLPAVSWDVSPPQPLAHPEEGSVLVDLVGHAVVPAVIGRTGPMIQVDIDVGSIAGQVFKNVSDTASGADVSSLIQPTQKAVVDSGSAADSRLVNAALPVTDTATGADVSAQTVSWSRTDSAIASDVSGLIAGGLVSVTDSVAGADVSSLTATAAVTDSGTGADTSVTDKAVSDSGSAADVSVLTAAPAVSDTGNASDASSVSTGGGVITRVQTGTAATTTGTGIVAPSWPAATGAGNLLVAIVGSGRSTAQPTLTPPAGGAWTLAVEDWGTLANEMGTHIYYIANAPSRSGTESFTLSVARDVYAVLLEYSGVAASSPLDVTNSLNGGGVAGQPATNTTATIAQANELVIAALANANVETSSGDAFGGSATGGTLAKLAEATSGNATANQKLTARAYERIVTGSGTAEVHATLATARLYTGSIATFKA